MADSSAIEWCDTTWNPTTGCTKISPGCANCYIERTPPFRMAGRKFFGGKIPLMLHEDRLTAPLKWKKPRLVLRSANRKGLDARSHAAVVRRSRNPS